MKNYHLVILKQPYFDAILTGQKQIESRFTKTRREPFGQIQAGDRLLLKISSGPVCATANVAAVKSFENLTPQKIEQIKEEYNHYIKGSDEIWRSRYDCKFGLLIWLADVEPIEPVRIHKKDWRAWVVLTEKEDFGLLRPGVVKKMAPLKPGGQKLRCLVSQRQSPG
jgi:ASC-1-like (ASCH) protein